MDDTGWHLDRKVPIALITVIFLQTSSIIWWAATTSERVNKLEEHSNGMSQTLNELQTEINIQGREDVKIAQQLANTATALERLADDYRETNKLLRQYVTGQHEPGP